MSNRETIGAYMIVKNEESCLATCLESIQGLDDIVILDTGSKDGTKQVAEKFDCRFIDGKYEWEDSFCKARNKAMTYIDTDWLLVIDADERLDGGVDALYKCIEENKNASCITFNTISEKWGNEHFSIRMHRNKPDTIFWHGDAHNYLSVSGGPLIKDAAVYYGYSDAHALDPDRTLRILTKAVKSNPKLAREKYYLAREHYYRKDWKLAIYYWQYYFETATNPAEIADAHLYIARCHGCLGEIDKAKDECLQAIKMNGNFREAWRFLASLSGPGNKKRFNEIADTASNQGVLFVRGL